MCIKHWWSSEKGRHGHVWIRFSFRFISLINLRLNKTPTILQVRFSNAFSWLIKMSMKFVSESQTNTTSALVPLTHLGTISPIPPCDFKRNKEICGICVSREIKVVFTRHKGDTRLRGVNGLIPSRRQLITRTNAEPVQRLIHASPECCIEIK